MGQGRKDEDGTATTSDSFIEIGCPSVPRSQVFPLEKHNLRGHSFKSDVHFFFDADPMEVEEERVYSFQSISIMEVCDGRSTSRPESS